MARWDKIGGIGNVEDRRGVGAGTLFAGGGGLVAILLTLGLNFLGLQVPQSTVEDILLEMEQLQSLNTDDTTQASEFRGQDDYEVFAARVLGSSDEMWTTIFQENNMSYQKPKLVLFRSATTSACGIASSQVGPHYCPADNTIYLDETFFDTLKSQFGADSGEVAQAYVIAHEVGHHVQNQFGDLSARSTQEQAIILELQADCYAGVWAYTQQKRGVITADEIQQAQSAASAVGDDNIQQKTEGRVTPENWTHGSSEQRVNALMKGFTTGNPGECTDFSS